MKIRHYFFPFVHENKNKHSEHANWTVAYIYTHTRISHTHIYRTIAQDVNVFFFFRCDISLFFDWHLTIDLHLYGGELVSFPTFLIKHDVIERFIAN